MGQTFNTYTDWDVPPVGVEVMFEDPDCDGRSITARVLASGFYEVCPIECAGLPRFDAKALNEEKYFRCCTDRYESGKDDDQILVIVLREIKPEDVYDPERDNSRW